MVKKKKKKGNLFSQSSRTSEKLGGFARENPQLTSSPEPGLFSVWNKDGFEGTSQL